MISSKIHVPQEGPVTNRDIPVIDGDSPDDQSTHYSGHGAMAETSSAQQLKNSASSRDTSMPVRDVPPQTQHMTTGHQRRGISEVTFSHNLVLSGSLQA